MCAHVFSELAYATRCISELLFYVIRPYSASCILSIAKDTDLENAEPFFPAEMKDCDPIRSSVLGKAQHKDSPWDGVCLTVLCMDSDLQKFPVQSVHHKYEFIFPLSNTLVSRYQECWCCHGLCLSG